MELEDVENIIKSTGFPYAYYAYPEKEAPELPYVLYYYPGEGTETADDAATAKIARLNIELYTQNKSFSDESKIEAVLDGYEIPYDKTESYLDDEHMFEVLYETEVILDNGQS